MHTPGTDDVLISLPSGKEEIFYTSIGSWESFLHSIEILGKAP